jgi:hypothetical protein
MTKYRQIIQQIYLFALLFVVMFTLIQLYIVYNI